MSCNVSSNDKHRRGGCPCETHRGESPGDELAHGIVYVDLGAGSLHNGSVSDCRLDGARYCQMAHMTFLTPTVLTCLFFPVGMNTPTVRFQAHIGQSSVLYLLYFRQGEAVVVVLLQHTFSVHTSWIWYRPADRTGRRPQKATQTIVPAFRRTLAVAVVHMAEMISRTMV